MAYFAKTTGQGQGFAQVVKQDRVAEDYLEQERKRQEAAAKKQSMMSRMDYLGRNLSGVYKAGFNQTLEDIRSKAVSGELDAKTAVEILDMEAKNLKSMQDEALKYSKEDRRNQISWDNDIVKNPDIYLYEQSFNQENYENPYDIIQSNVDLITRTEDYPESIDQQFYKRYMPLLRENKNIVTSEELQGIGDDDELLTAIKNQTISYSPEALDKLKEEYIGDEEVLRRIALENNLYEIKDGMVDVTDLNAVQKIAEDFFNSMTKPKSQFTEQQRKDTGKGGLNFNFGGGRGETEIFNITLTKEKAVEKGEEISGGKVAEDYEYDVMTLRPKPSVRTEVKGRFSVEGNEIVAVPTKIYNDNGNMFVEISYEDPIMGDMKSDILPYDKAKDELATRFGISEDYVNLVFSGDKQGEGNNQQEEILDEEVDLGF